MGAAYSPDSPRLSFGSVCSGVSAASMSWNPLGWYASWFHEIEPLPSAVLATRYPYAANHGDMRQAAQRIASGELVAPDVFCGGTPCQAFSVAGARRSLDDARGNLTLTFCEIANEIDRRRDSDGRDPCVVFWENVPGVLNTKDNAFGCLLAGLAGESDALVPPGGKWTNAGVVLGPQRAVAWRVLDAQYFGLAQRRRRVFVVASARAGFDPAELLFEFDGVRRDSPPRRETREEVACLAGGGLAFGGNNTGGAIDVATALNACGSASGRMDFESETFVVQCVTGDVTHTLKAEGFDASEDGTDRGQPIVPVIEFVDGRSDTWSPTEAPCAAYGTKLHNTKSNQAGKFYEEHTAGLDRNSPPPAVVRLSKLADKLRLRVRRLTPTECERLQGFPDGHTAIQRSGKPAADGPRYKAIGNSWAVNCTRWLGERIDYRLRLGETEKERELKMEPTEIIRTGNYVVTALSRPVPAMSDMFEVRLESQLLTAKRPEERRLMQQLLLDRAGMDQLIKTLQQSLPLLA